MAHTLPVHVFNLPASVDRVIDGDTIVCHVDVMPELELHGIHVRIEGINAPELHHAGGPAAKEFLVGLLARPDPVTLVATKRDKYGRLLARVVLVNGEDVSTLMLANGHAVVMA